MADKKSDRAVVATDEKVEGRFKKGDRVIVVAKKGQPGSWCTGCHGIVSGMFPIAKRPPAYLIRLDDSPNPVIKSSWIYEDELKRE